VELLARREAPELVVGDEAALLGAEPLHLRQQARPLVLRHVEGELGDLDPDRVDAALLAEDDPAVLADELRGIRLDRGRVVELRRDRS